MWFLLAVVVYVMLYQRFHRRGWFPGQRRWTSRRKPGFQAGLLHGVFLPANLIWRFQDPQLLVYVTDHRGFIYDAGLLLGCVLPWIVLV